MVREDGPRATMESMAAAGGVTKPILYRHFGDRRGLVAAIGERFQRELGDAINAALETQGRPGDGSVLRATIDAYLSLVERETELYRFLVQQDARSGNEISSAFVAQVTAQVAGWSAARWSPPDATRRRPSCGRSGSSAWSTPPATGGPRNVPSSTAGRSSTD